ncbi:hypothetical protein GLOIN_2v1777707 [Rhizophagus irregularis DAOM 181602=DAOM 197198]|nr:hypothetical protein GLOIN_2v1777707 [Rhizophagus irregularis DAOM 181602=DAOM 197198]
MPFYNLSKGELKLYKENIVEKKQSTKKKFEKFWLWISIQYTAKQYTGATVATFKVLKTEFFITTQLNTLIELSFYLHKLFELTNGFKSLPTDIQVTNAYQIFHNTSVNNNANMNKGQMKELIKLCQLFEAAFAVNRWPDNRKVALAARFLKEAAHDWYEDNKGIINQWHIDYNANNFDIQFIAYFATAARMNHLKPFLVGQVVIGNANTLEVTITRAKLVKLNVNTTLLTTTLATTSTTEPISTTTTTVKPTPQVDEMEALTKQMQQLALNYANLSSVLMMWKCETYFQNCQMGRNTNNRNGNNNNNNRPHQRAPITPINYADDEAEIYYDEYEDEYKEE